MIVAHNSSQLKRTKGRLMTTLSIARIIIDTDPGIDDAIALTLSPGCKGWILNLLLPSAEMLASRTSPTMPLSCSNSGTSTCQSRAVPPSRQKTNGRKRRPRCVGRGYEFDGIQPDCLLEETALEAQRRVIMEGASAGEKTTR